MSTLNLTSTSSTKDYQSSFVSLQDTYGLTGSYPMMPSSSTSSTEKSKTKSRFGFSFKSKSKPSRSTSEYVQVSDVIKPEDAFLTLQETFGPDGRRIPGSSTTVVTTTTSSSPSSQRSKKSVGSKPVKLPGEFEYSQFYSIPFHQSKF